MIVILYGLLYFIQGITVGFFIHLMLTPKNTKRCIFFWFLYGLFIIVGRFGRNYIGDFYTAMSIGAYVVLLLIPLTQYKDALWKRIAATLTVVAGIVIANFIGMLGVLVVNPDYMNLFTEVCTVTLIVGILAYCIMVVILTIFLMIWNRLLKGALMKDFLPTMLLPVGMLSAACGIDAVIASKTVNVDFLLIVINMLLPIVFIYWLYDLLFRKKQAEKEQQMREIRYAMQLEQAHYQDIESKRDTIAKLRHDMKNQLAAARRLVESGNRDAAETMINQLEEIIASTNEYPFCAVPVVNAILNEKKEECDRKDIRLETDIRIPEDISLEGTVLCSLFGNLTDNAIRAVEELGMEERWIRISAIAEGGFLVIKTVNPSEEPGELRPGHGKGTAILKFLAESHGGEYRAEYVNRLYTAVVSLELTGNV